MEWVYADLKKLIFPFYCVELPVLMGNGRQREINRKERVDWLRDKGVVLQDRPRKLLFSCLHVWGYFFIDDYVTALEFQLRFQ